MNAWDIYPRPHFRRDSFFSLTGEWDFAISEKDMIDKYDKKIEVPFPPESELSGIRESHKDGEFLFYRKTFLLPKGFADAEGDVILHFEAIDQECTVFLNGAMLGEQKGGYLSFSFSITSFLKEENVLTVRAKDDLDKHYPYGKQTKKPHGMWYTPFSGIIGSVWLEFIPKNGIKNIRVTASDTGATISVESESRALSLTYSDGEEEVTVTFEKEVTISPRHAHLWSPEDPFLYHFTVKSESDSAKSYFALRRFEVKKAGERMRFFLNGKPYLLHGVLDQGYFKDGICLPKEPREYERDILRMKELGFNMLRKHIKLEPSIFYEACDRLGMVVFQDAINNGGYSFLWHTALPTVGLKYAPRFLLRKNKKAKETFRLLTEQLLDEVTFHPSVLMFTIFNEGWGQADADALYREWKKKYPSLLFDTASGWFKTSSTDMRSDHVYFKKIKANYKNERKPIILSEFGGYSFPIEGHTFTVHKNYGYGICTDRESYMKRLESLYMDEVLPAVRVGVSALVYTQLSDVEDETNGLYTYDREILKADEERMRRIALALKEAYTAACEEE